LEAFSVRLNKIEFKKEDLKFIQDMYIELRKSED